MLSNPKKKLKPPGVGSKASAETIEELEERHETIKQKFEQRKATKKNSNTKSERKKLRQEKLMRKQKIISRKKTITNELIKQEHSAKKVVVKSEPKQESAIYNKDSKLFFSKVQIDGEKKKKGHDTNPKANLMKLKAQTKKLKELVESGDKSKAKEEKSKILWKAAFEKTEGIKVKDNPEILKKTIKKRKVEKKKSKVKWGERKQKVQEKQDVRQKKREDNLNKRKTDNQKTKMKQAVKKGRHNNN